MSLDLGSTYWNGRYLTDKISWDAGNITTPLKLYFDQLKNKNLNILIPGAGNAYEAEYLSNNGFRNVFVCDIAPAPLENLKKRCPTFDKDHLLLVDFFKLDSNKILGLNKGFDIIIEQTFFCALDPSLRKKYFEKVNDLLSPKGKLTGLLFDDALNADGPPFGGNAEEYKSYFKDLLKINTFEKCYNSIKPREGRELFINLEKSK